jgi:NCS1 family nucleobase:cation symporter-1
VSTSEASSGHASVDHKAAGEESLAPQQKRIMGRTSYLLAWMGGCVSIGTFTVGSSLVGTLNLVQSLLAVTVGCVGIGIGLAVNGAAGYKYGIPFVVQVRSSFGMAGTKIPGLVRAVPALVWYGFQSWVGAVVPPTASWCATNESTPTTSS